MQDRETKTLWNHITGEALYGPRLGHTLGPVGNLLQMSVAQALELDPEIRIGISDRAYFAHGQRFGTAPGLIEATRAEPPGRGRGPAPGGPDASGPGRGGPGTAPGERELLSAFADTLGVEDTRRPRMELGLGVWNGDTSRYYPVERIREHDEALIDDLDGRTLVVYLDPATNTPAAVFANAAGAVIKEDEVRLDDGSVIRGGVMYDAAGARIDVERPMQIFTRWYGFALTFPDPEVFGD